MSSEVADSRTDPQRNGHTDLNSHSAEASQADAERNTDHFRRIDGEAKRQRKHLIARAVFSGLFIVMLVIVTITKNEQRQVLAITECIKDYTFVWTESINTFFVENTAWKDFAIIQSSVGIDFMMISFLVIFALYGTTTRIIMTLIMFYPSRNVI